MHQGCDVPDGESRGNLSIVDSSSLTKVDAPWFSLVRILVSPGIGYGVVGEEDESEILGILELVALRYAFGGGGGR